MYYILSKEAREPSDDPVIHCVTVITQPYKTTPLLSWNRERGNSLAQEELQAAHAKEEHREPA